MSPDFLIGTVSPWLVAGLLIFTVIVFLLKIPTLLTEFIKFDKGTKLLLVAALVLGTFVRFAWVPNMDRIYFDEDRYLAYAVTFARFNQAKSIEAASPTRLIRGKVDTVARVTVPVVNGLVFKIFGFSKQNLHLASKTFGTLQVLLIFIGTYLLLKRTRVAGSVAVLMALLPVPVYWSTSTALDSYFVFFSLLAFVAATWYAQSPKLSSALFLVASTTLLIFVRFEALLFLFVELAVIFTIRLHNKKPLLQINDFKFAVIALPLLLLRVAISFSVLGKTWCCGEATPLEAFTAGYFIRNTIPNIASLFNRPEFPFILTILAIITLFGNRDKRIIPLGLWAFFYFFIYSFYFAGLFYTHTFSGSYGRYFLMLVPPFLILASITVGDASKLYNESSQKMRITLSILLLIAGLSLVQTVRGYRYMIFISAFDSIVDRPARLNQDYLRYQILPQTPKNSIYIHPLVSWVVMEGRTGTYFAEFVKSDELISYVRHEAKKGVPVFMIQTNTCTVHPEKCEKILPHFTLNDYPIKEATPSGQSLLKLELIEASQSAR